MEDEHRHHPRTNNEETLWTVERSSRPITTGKEETSLFRNTPKQQLENYFTASVLLIALLFVTLLVSIFAGTKPDLFSSICHTPQCVRSGLTLLEAMNASVNPCEDFYEFACGNYKADYPADVEDESIQNWMTEQTIKQKKFFIAELRKDNLNEDPSGVRAARRVFKACQNMEIEPLGECNFESWSVYTWAVLTKKDMFRYVSGEIQEPNVDSDKAETVIAAAQWKRADRKARAEMVLTILPAAINAVGMKSMWDTLEKLGLPRHPLNSTGKELPWTRTLGRALRFLALDPIIGFGVSPSIHNSAVNLIALFTPEDTGDVGIFGGWSLLKLISKKKSTAPSSISQWKNYINKIVSYVVEADEKKFGNPEQLANVTGSIIRVFKVIVAAVKADSYSKDISSVLPTQMTVDDFQKVLDNSSSSGASKLQVKSFLEEIFSDFPELSFDYSQELLKVYRVRYYQTLSRLLDHLSDQEIQHFIWWKVVSLLAIHTNEDLMYLKDKMMRNLGGGKFPTLSRETVCYYNVVQLMKPSLGYFILREFKNSKVDQVEKVVSNVKDTLVWTIRNQEWLDDRTKRASVDKVKAVKFSIGVPQWMKNASSFDELYRSRGENRPGVRDGQIPLYEFKHLENLQTLVDFAVKEMMKQLGTLNSFDSDEFDPTLINAYYETGINSVTIPFAILDLPVYGWGIEALNYGSIGGFIGHELNHGFDTTGILYNEDGVIRQWWPKSILVEHEKRASCFARQFSEWRFSYHNVSVKLDGNRTVDENMSDLEGLNVAFKAYKAYTYKHPPERRIPGLQEYTHEQMFFLAFARAKCTKYTQYGLSETLDDVHPPDFARVVATLRNSPEFSQAWNCPVGSFMNPEKKCRLWS